MKFQRAWIYVAALIASPLLTPSVFAQTATDLNCSQCVGSSDLANESVGSAKIKDGSVSSNDLAPNAARTVNINNGAVTFNKLAPGLRDQVENSIGHIWLEVIADIHELAAGVQCPAETYPVSASCACDDEDGFRNFGFLYNCEIVGPGVTAACFVDDATFDPERSDPAARVHAYCLAATRSDGTRWSPFPQALPPSHPRAADAPGLEQSEAEWHKAQFDAYEAALAKVRKTAALRNSRVRGLQ